MHAARKCMHIIVIVIISTSGVFSNCISESEWLTGFGPVESTIQIEYIVKNDDINENNYTLAALLSWQRPDSSIDFDGYVVKYTVLPNKSNDLPSCVIEDTDLYVGNESVILSPLKFNYQYEYEIKVANIVKNRKTLGDGTKYFNHGADCYQETNDYEFCSTLDPQYPSAPADVIVTTIANYKDTLVNISWLRPIGPNAKKTTYYSIRTAKHGLLDNANSSKLEPLKHIDEGEVNVENEERWSTTINRKLIPGVVYDLKTIALDSNGKNGIPTIVSFNASAPSPTSNTPEPEKTSQSKSMTYVIAIGVVAVIFSISLISCGYYVRYKRSSRPIPQFKRDPDTISISKGTIDKDIEERLCESEYGELEFGRHLLKLEEVLGSGQFGIVYKGFALGIDGGNDYVQVAVKCLKSNASKAMKEDFLDEIRLINEIGSHPNILSVMGCCTLKEPYYLITEYMRYGDLLHFLQKCQPEYAVEDAIYDLKEENRLQIARQITRGMDYLSKTRYYHGDLAARNILVGIGLLVKISDFGLADDIYQSGYKRLAPEKKRPVKWVSLETNIEGKCTIKSDVWSFGIVLYEIYTNGGTPYPDMDAASVIQKLITGYRMEIPSGCPLHIYDIMLECWKTVPSERPTFNGLFLTFDRLLEMDSDYLETDTAPSVIAVIQENTVNSFNNSNNSRLLQQSDNASDSSNDFDETSEAEVNTAFFEAINCPSAGNDIEFIPKIDDSEEDR